MRGRLFILSFLLFLFVVPGSAKPVTKAEAAEVVYELLASWGQPAGIQIIQMDPHYLADGSLAFYMVDLGSKGWVLVSGDDVLSPVLAFSFENRMTPLDQWTDAAAYLLDVYRNDIELSLKNKDLKRDVRWDGLQLPTLKGSTEDIRIEPIIDVKWNQGSGWNMFCPADEDGPGGHAYVGCVAVSMAQAMTVYEYPAKGVGIKSYLHDDYGSITVNYDQAEPYAWSEMGASSYDSANAMLLYHCAVSVEMGFGADGSGAYVRTAARAMKQYFSYSSNLSFMDRLPDAEEWEALLVDELVAGRPIVYRGEPGDGTAGHAWNVDGYGDGYFHMNFGWSGSQNGYYTLDLINPGSNDFSENQGAMIGIEPPVSGPLDISLSGTSIEEGLAIGSYVADVSVEDEDLNNVYTFTCKGKFNIILDDYEESSFYIEDGKLLTGEVLEYNDERPDRNSEFLLIIVEDQYGNEFEKDFSIDILKAYAGPTGISLSDSTVKEMQPVGTAVACVMVEDEDTSNSYVYRTYGPFDPDSQDFTASLFYMDGDTLRTDVVFDLELSDTAYVLIELEDAFGNILSRPFTINIESDQSGSTGLKPVQMENGLVFPNPADQFLKLNNAESLASFEMYEISTGRLVLKMETPSERIDVSQLPEGAYFIMIQRGAEVKAQKVLISR